ncbi:MAG: MFS transporter [Candidatus Limivicinus sp.]|nr:MFS transporter [Candidatus Limivicinus sp.]
MANTKKANFKKYLTLFIVALAGGIITKLPYLRETYMEPLSQATGATYTQLGLIMSAYGIVNFICYFPGGVLADKFSCKTLIVISCFGTALAGFWYWTLPSFIWLVVIHAVFAITTVFTFWAAMVKSINRLGTEEEQGRLFGLLEGGRGLIGTLVAFGSVAVFGIASDAIGGMKNAILYYSILMAVAGVLAVIFLENDKPVAKEAGSVKPLNKKDFIEVAKMPRVWLCGALGICNYSALIFHGYITGYLSNAFGLSDTVVGNLSVIRTYVMMMLGAFVAGFIADKIGSRIKLIKWAFVGMAIFASLYVLIPTHGAGVPLVICNFVVYGLFLYSIKAMYFSTIDEVLVPKRLAGTASGIISLCTYAPEVFLYTVSGNIVDKYVNTATPLRGYHICFIMMAVLSVIGFICGTVLMKMNEKARAEAHA